MEKLIIYLVILGVIIYLAFMALSILAMIGPFILACIAAVGAISGIYVGFEKFFEVLQEAHNKTAYRRAGKVLSYLEQFIESQPSFAMYPFDGGWQVIVYVQNNIFPRTQAASVYWYGEATKWQLKAKYESNRLLKYWKYSAYIGFQVAGFFQNIFAPVLVGLFFGLQAIFLSAWMGSAAILMAILYAYNFLYGHYNKIYCRCPECHEQMVVPIYVCPTCFTEHTRLWPSAYGIFHHSCAKCETKLPTIDYFGRKDLIRKCSACHSPMSNSVGMDINVHIPVIGGINSGKSNFIFMATNQFINNYAQKNGMETNFPDEKHKLFYETQLKQLNSGQKLSKTREIIPQAINLKVKKPNKHLGHILYMYDAAGEAFASDADISQQKAYYRYIDGLVFIIDPFSIEHFSKIHENEINPIRQALSPTTLSVMDAYERMIVVLQSSFGFIQGEKIKVPLAIVVSKTDALELDRRIGLTAAREVMAKNPQIRLETDAMGTLVEGFLVENGLGNFVRDVHMQFGEVSFFACSALGRLPDPKDTKPFSSVGVLEPFLWLLGNAGVVNWNKERSTRMDNEHQGMSSGKKNILEKFKYYVWDSLIPRE